MFKVIIYLPNTSISLSDKYSINGNTFKTSEEMVTYLLNLIKFKELICIDNPIGLHKDYIFPEHITRIYTE